MWLLDGRVGGGGGGGTDHQQPINQSHSMVLFISVRSIFFLFWVLAYLPFEGGGLLQDDGREHCLFFGGLSVCIVCLGLVGGGSIPCAKR